MNEKIFADLTQHWGGDTNSNFADMYQGIAQALQFSIAGIPYFGVDTGGLNGNADMSDFNPPVIPTLLTLSQGNRLGTNY